MTKKGYYTGLNLTPRTMMFRYLEETKKRVLAGSSRQAMYYLECLEREIKKQFKDPTYLAKG